MDDVFVSSLSRHWLVKAAEQQEKLLVIMVHSNADRNKVCYSKYARAGLYGGAAMDDKGSKEWVESKYHMYVSLEFL